MSPRETAQTKAHRLLVEGRVVVTEVFDRHVHAVVRGDSGAFYETTHRGVLWRCTCQARGDKCSHIAAVRMVTAPQGVPR